MYVLTESEKKNIEDTVKTVKALANTDCSKFNKEVMLKKRKLESILDKAKQKVKENLSLDKDPFLKWLKVHGFEEFTFKGLINTVRQYITELGTKYKDTKWIKSTLIYAAMIAMGYGFRKVFETIAFRFFPGNALYLLDFVLDPLWICVVGPIVEEMSKYLSVKFKSTNEFFTIFNISEMSGYLFGGWGSSLPTSKFSFTTLLSSGNFIKAFAFLPLNIVSRFITVLMHTLTTKIISDKDSKIRSIGLRALVGMIIHILWNTFIHFLPFGGFLSFSTMTLIGIIYARYLHKKTSSQESNTLK